MAARLHDPGGMERACSSSPMLIRPAFLAQLVLIVFAGATVWFAWHPERSESVVHALVAPPAGPCAMEPGARAAQASATPAAVNVVDVASLAVTPELVAQLVRLADGERITAVDDHAVASSLEAGTLLGERVSRITRRAHARLADAAVFYGSGGEYIDLTIHGEIDDSSRRVLVLFH